MSRRQLDHEFAIGKIAEHAAAQPLPGLQAGQERRIAGLAARQGRARKNPG
jgi:hypothetical protein